MIPCNGFYRWRQETLFAGPNPYRVVLMHTILEHSFGNVC